MEQQGLAFVVGRKEDTWEDKNWCFFYSTLLGHYPFVRLPNELEAYIHTKAIEQYGAHEL